MSRISDFKAAGRSRVGSRVENMDRAVAPIEVTDIYKILVTDLKRLFALEQPKEARMALLEGHGGPSGILAKVQSEGNTGIMGDERDLYRRQSFFGVNEKPLPPKDHGFLQSLKEALQEKILFVLLIMAILSAITGVIYTPATGWIEGVSIIVALLILVLLTAINDLQKDNTFVKLQSIALDESLTTIRGKIGAKQSINVWELVVGDVVVLTAGDKVPCDAIMVESQNLAVDQEFCEAIDEPADRTVIPKSVETDPFLYADSYIQQGSCKAVITCVGRHCTRGIEGKKLDTSSRTPLEAKLFNLSKTFTFLGIIGALIILAVQIVMLLLGTGFSDSDSKGAMFLKKLIEDITLAFIVIIVAIPEGLPMTVVISLSGSVIKMYNKDKILVRDLSAPEKMGEITEILCGKTGTMTTEEMEVISCFAQNCHISMFRKDTVLNCAFSDTTVDFLKESILWNTEAHIEITDNSFYVPTGNGTEVSLINWLQGAEIPVHKIMLEREGRVRAWIPFDTKLKRSIIAVAHPLIEHTVRVYIKGAPETIIENCVAHFDQTGNKLPFDQQARNYALDEIMRDSMTKKGFRAMAFSFKDYSVDDFAGLDNFHSEQTIRELESGQTFIGMVGMKDPLRDRVKQVVEYARKGQINIRMVSGDNLDTAKAIAFDSGILVNDKEKNICEYDPDGPLDEQRKYAMDAKDFRETCGPVEKTQDEDGKTIHSLPNQQAFNQIMATLKVLGRATPEDKLLLTVGLQNMQDADYPNGGRKVAVVGDGLNDLESIEAANVSFAMGSGKSISRNSASMILCANDFEAILRAVMWGRNIYSNVRRFLQFQVTCNIACIVTIIIGCIFLTESPLGPTQLIWINLIMDILGAMALATMQPLASVIHQPAVTVQTKVLNKTIWRQIYGVAVWMVAVMFVVIWMGRAIYGLDYEKDTQTTDRCPKDDNGNRPSECPEKSMAIAKKTHMTMIFTTFVFLQFFNEINCRVIGPSEYNIFKKFFHQNWTFILVLCIIFFVQWSACEWFTLIFETTQITGEQFGQCILSASTVLIAAFVLKLTPAAWVEKIPENVNEDEVMGRDSFLMKNYDNHATGKIPDFRKGINQEVDPENEGLTQEPGEDDGFQKA